MHTDLSLNEIKKEWHGSIKSYAIGFGASFLLTSTSFFLVLSKWLTEKPLILTLVSLAMVQAIFQLLFFLHVGQEAKPKWETVVFYFMLLLLLIIVIGSLWIMYDLNERVMSNMSMEQSHD